MNEAKIKLSIDGVKSVVSGFKDVGNTIGSVTESLRTFTAVGGALSLAALAGKIHGVIDELATLDDMAQKTGSSVENLSRLQKVASAFGQDFGNVDSSLSKLAKGMASVDDDSNKAQQALKALGVSAVDETGNLRDTSEVMIDVAKALQDYKDDASKAALVTDLFGKAGADLIPYLNDVAENVDRFSGVSADAAKQAADFQDKLGILRVKSNDFFEKLAINLLPTMSDLVDALRDTATESGQLGGDKSLVDWADSAAVGLARVVDIAKLIPNVLRAIGGSFEVVGADVEVLGKASQLLTPAGIAGSFGRGENPYTELKVSLEKRNKILTEANERYVALWNKPANQTEQSVLAKIAGRKSDEVGRALALISGADESSSASDQKKSLKYSSGGSKATKDAKQPISDYEKLTRSIREKTAAEAAEIKTGGELSEAEKIRTKLMADLESKSIKMKDSEVAKIQADLFVLEVTEQLNAARKESVKFQEQQIAAANKAAQDAIKEAEANEWLAQTFGKSKSEIEQMEIARIEEQIAQKASLDLTTQEVAAMERQIAAKRRSVAALKNIENAEKTVEEQKKAAAESQKVWDNFTENVQRNLGDGLYDAMNGNFKNIGQAFKSMLLRMSADAMAADIMGAITGKKSSSAFGSVFSSLGNLMGGGASSSVSSAAEISAAGEIGVGLMSFDGGGFTGGGSRSGGIDGKGGFPAILHPNETVLDHTKGQSSGGKSVSITYAPVIKIDSRADRGAIMSDVQRLLQADKADLMDRMDREAI